MRIFYDSNCYKASFIFGNFARIKTGNAAYIMCKNLFTLWIYLLWYIYCHYMANPTKNNKNCDLSLIQDE